MVRRASCYAAIRRRRVSRVIGLRAHVVVWRAPWPIACFGFRDGSTRNGNGLGPVRRELDCANVDSHGQRDIGPNNGCGLPSAQGLGSKRVSCGAMDTQGATHDGCQFCSQRHFAKGADRSPYEAPAHRTSGSSAGGQFLLGVFGQRDEFAAVNAALSPRHPRTRRPERSVVAPIAHTTDPTKSAHDTARSASRTTAKRPSPRSGARDLSAWVRQSGRSLGRDAQQPRRPPPAQ